MSSRLARLVLLALLVPWTSDPGAAGSNEDGDRGGVDRGVVASVAKCCEPEEVLLDDTCTPLVETNETKWQPEFLEGRRRASKSSGLDYRLEIGRPRCRPNEHQWHVYDYRSGTDRLVLLRTGVLRHYAVDPSTRDEGIPREAFEENAEEEDPVSIHYDYPFGHYCADKAILSRDRLVATYAMVCVPEVPVRWTDTNYFMRRALDPAFHALSIASYLVVAVVYFVLPQLRDLVGNMISSMTLCLIASQCASTVRIFTEFGNHVSFLVADTVMYVALLAAFFWLNALGYYVWSTFRSRNVFLRVTDGRKYCYYSTYVWGSTVCIAGTAIFAHFTLETERTIVGGSVYPAQETIGWLGISVLLASVAFTIMIDLCFVRATAHRIKRMSTYGRIHHKIKYSFRMFVFLFTIMSVGWLSLLLSRLTYDALAYAHIVINFLQAALVLYVCVFGQRRVTFLLGKTCNCRDPAASDNTEGLDWGEEMTAINAGY